MEEIHNGKMKREKWIIKTLRGRTRSQMEESYQGFISIIDNFSMNFLYLY